jgi:hypothetical protein
MSEEQNLNPSSTTIVDRTAFSVGTLSDEGDEKVYWQLRTPSERLLAIELTRQYVYGYVGTTPRLQRILEVAKLGAG